MNVVVIAPHPDDESIGPGGALAHHVDSGDTVSAIYLTSGCASITNPVADGVPVHRLPEEIFPPPRVDMKPIPLTSLRQPPPEGAKPNAHPEAGEDTELAGDTAGGHRGRSLRTSHRSAIAEHRMHSS